MPNHFLAKEINKFRYAFRGISFLLSEVHFRIHLVASVMVISLGFYFDVSNIEWAVLLLSISSVMVAEGLNSAIELLVDAWIQEKHQLAGKIKDIAAGSVLIASMIALIVGLLIFTPKVKHILNF